MPLDFYDDGEILDKLWEYYSSHEWYIFFTSGSSIDVASKIEYTYYTPGTEAAKDFGVIIRPDATGVFLAKKKWMSSDQLFQILYERISDREKAELKRKWSERGGRTDTIPFINEFYPEESRSILSFYGEVTQYFLQKEIESHGMDKMFGKNRKCGWRHTVQAKEQGRMEEECLQPANKVIMGLGPGRQVNAVVACDEHHASYQKWAAKQPSIY